MTLLLGAMSTEGPVLVTDGLTTGLSGGPVTDTIKIANLPAGSAVVVMTAGRATFGQTHAIEECRRAVQSASLDEVSAGRVRDHLRLHLMSVGLQHATTAQGVSVVCVERAEDAMRVAVSHLNFVAGIATQEPPAIQAWLNEGDSDAQEFALGYLESLVTPSPSCHVLDALDVAMERLSKRSAAGVHDVLRDAISFAGRKQEEEGLEINVGGKTRAVLMARNGVQGLNV